VSSSASDGSDVSLVTVPANLPYMESYLRR
jgi:hypothetical protein